MKNTISLWGMFVLGLGLGVFLFILRLSWSTLPVGILGLLVGVTFPPKTVTH